MATPVNATVLKALDALELFGPGRALITTEMVAQELGMAQATAHRVLVTLNAAGMVTAPRRGVYAPGPRLARLGRMAEDLAPLPPILPALLDRLRRALGESVMACRYSPDGPLCVAVSAADRPISVNIRTGTVLPMLTTAQGRLWLAEMTPAAREAWALRQGIPLDALSALAPALDRAGSEGCARNRGENEPDIAAVSVPVRQAGRVVLTLSVFGMLSRFDNAFMVQAERLLKEAAADLAAGGEGT